MKVPVDTVSGDYAPKDIIKAAVMAAREYKMGIILVGPQNMIEAELSKYNISGLEIEIVHGQGNGEGFAKVHSSTDWKDRPLYNP